MSNVTPAQNEWLDKVFALASSKLIAYPREDAFRIELHPSAFWSALPLVPDFRPNYEMTVDKTNATFFAYHLQQEDKDFFLLGQKMAISKMNKDILAIEGDIPASLQDIEARYFLGAKKGSPLKALLNIHDHRDYFDANPVLHPITRISDIALSLVSEKSNIESKKDLGDFLAAHFRAEYAFDLKPGTVLRLIDDTVYNEIRNDIESVFLQRAEGAPAIKRLETIKGGDIKTPRGIAAHFSEETVRPKRPPDEGSQVGFGRAKPDLWKPEGMG